MWRFSRLILTKFVKAQWTPERWSGVIGIVNEPMPWRYYATAQHVSGRVPVYDLGGGTLRVIMDVDGRNINIEASQATMPSAAWF